MLPLTREIRRVIRCTVGVRWAAMPVHVVPGDAAPREEGAAWHYRTRGGTIIAHPSAYRKVGWSNMVYYHSTRCIVCGVDWVRVTYPKLYAACIASRLTRSS